MRSPRRSAAVAAGAVAVVALVLGLVMVGSAGGGRWELETRFNLFPANPRPVTTTTQPQGGSLPEVEDLPDFWIINWDLVGWITIIVVGVAVAWTLWKLWNIYQARLRPAQFSPAPGRPVAMQMPELPILEQGVEAALDYLKSIRETDDAIIAAWLALEDAAAATGVPRKPSQTPTEFTVSVLEATDADRGAVTGLLRLYHLARFSDHPISGSDIEQATQHLATLARGWRNRLTSVGPSETT